MDSVKDILSPLQNEIKSRLKVKQKWLREGVTMLPNMLLFEAELSLSARIVFACILAHAFNKGKSFPPNWLLQTELGISEPQVIKYKKELVRYGLIKVIRTGRANNYEIDFEALDKRADGIIKRLGDAKKKSDEKK